VGKLGAWLVAQLFQRFCAGLGPRLEHRRVVSLPIWRFKKHDFDLALGIRALSIDYDDGSGSQKFEWDVIQWGPVLALGFKF
jgi:hypothetical protein